MKTRVSPEIPTHCPNLKECTRKLDEEDFERFCISKSWIYCPLMKEEVRKYRPLATPCEWRMAKKIGAENEK